MSLNASEQTNRWVERAKQLVLRVGRVQASLIVLAGALLIVGYSRPSTVALDASCNLRRWIDRLRATVQGRDFWVAELELLDAEMERALSYRATTAAMRAEVQSRVEPAHRRAQRLLDSLYTAHPVLRPSPAQQAAQQLREVGDSLESAELDATVSALFERRAAALASCRAAVTARLEGS